MSRERAIRPAISAAAARRAAVDAEIDEEFALHLELLERELVESGAGVEEARREAAERFGDVGALRDRCRRIALKEQVMLERINTVALVLVVAGMVYLALRVERTQARTAAAVTAIAQRLGASPAAAAGSGERAAVATRTPQPVYVAAGVARPGVYQLPDASTTLRRLLISAGGVSLSAGSTFVVVHADGATESLTSDDLLDPTGADVLLRPGDRIEVRAPASESGGAAYFAPAVEADAARVYIGDGVARPGAYGLPAGGLTLRRLIDASGGLAAAGATRIVVVRADGASEEIAAADLADPGGSDIALRPGDRVEVR